MRELIEFWKVRVRIKLGLGLAHLLLVVNAMWRGAGMRSTECAVHCSPKSLHHFWATVCKTVRRMLSDRRMSCPICPVCLSCLYMTLVYCGQTVGRTKMKLGVRVGLGPGHIVIDEDRAPPPPKRTAPFSAHIFVAKWLDWSRCHLVGR